MLVIIVTLTYTIHLSYRGIFPFSQQGGLFAIYDDEEEERKEGGKEGEGGITIEPVPLVDFPEGVAFHPHGMYYHR